MIVEKNDAACNQPRIEELYGVTGRFEKIHVDVDDTRAARRSQSEQYVTPSQPQTSGQLS